METKYLLTHSLRDVLKLSVYDYNDILKDKLMGSTTVQILQTQADTTQDVAVIPLSRDGKQRGELRFSFNYFPALKGGVDVADTSGVFYLFKSNTVCLTYHLLYQRLESCVLPSIKPRNLTE